MMNVDTLTRRFEDVFTPKQATVLAQTITEAYSDLVKTGDFNELKAIVQRLAESQERTEAQLAELTIAQRHTDGTVAELAVAQQRTEVQLAELAAAQQRTDATVAELAVAQQRTTVQLAQLEQHTDQRFAELAVAQQRTETSLDRLARTVDGLAQELGGLSRSMAYALENEAYRSLPALLEAKHGIKLDEHIIRTEIGGEEINFFARGERNGQPIILVGESKTQLDERRNNRRSAERIFSQLEEKVQAVQKDFPNAEVVRFLITHYARPGMLQRARDRDVIVIQSFEW